MISNRLTDEYINESQNKKLKWDENQYKVKVERYAQ